MVYERQLYFLPQRRNDHPGISADACFAAGGDQEANKELTGTLVETVLALTSLWHSSRFDQTWGAANGSLSSGHKEL